MDIIKTPSNGHVACVGRNYLYVRVDKDQATLIELKSATSITIPDKAHDPIILGDKIIYHEYDRKKNRVFEHVDVIRDMKIARRYRHLADGDGRHSVTTYPLINDPVWFDETGVYLWGYAPDRSDERKKFIKPRRIRCQSDIDPVYDVCANTHIIVVSHLDHASVLSPRSIVGQSPRAGLFHHGLISTSSLSITCSTIMQSLDPISNHLLMDSINGKGESHFRIYDIEQKTDLISTMPWDDFECAAYLDTDLVVGLRPAGVYVFDVRSGKMAREIKLSGAEQLAVSPYDGAMSVCCVVYAAPDRQTAIIRGEREMAVARID